MMMGLLLAQNKRGSKVQKENITKIENIETTTTTTKPFIPKQVGVG
jgi:hypothetical protein